MNHAAVPQKAVQNNAAQPAMAARATDDARDIQIHGLHIAARQVSIHSAPGLPLLTHATDGIRPRGRTSVDSRRST